MYYIKYIEYILNKFLKKIRLTAVRNSNIDIEAKIHSGSSFVNSSIGKYSYCGYDCNFINTDIGSFCSIAGRVTSGGANHPMHFVSTSPVFLSHKDSIKKKFASFNYLPVNRTIIGSDVWIGEGVLIKAGVKIGVGAVIGMGSVVTKDVEPYAIVAGNPAKEIKKRFSQYIIDDLLKTEWWEMSDEKLYELGCFIDDPEEFLKKINYL